MAALRLLFNHLFAKLTETQADLTGRTFIVTGSNTGIGFALAVHLARRNPARLILGVRDLGKGEAAKKEIVAQTGFAGALEVWELDMARFESVNKFAERANSSLDRLDGAVLNAGINTWTWGLTPDGWERMLQVNGLATGLLGLLLLPLLQTTSKLPAPESSTFPMAPHLTFTSSDSIFLANFPEKSAPKILEAMNVEAGRDFIQQYTTTKLFELFFARKIAKLGKADGIVVNAVDPGLCYSEIARDMGLPAMVIAFFRLIAFSCAQGSLNVLYAVLSGTPSGAYIRSCQVRPPPAWTLTQSGFEAEDRVWSEMLDVWAKVSPQVVDTVA